MPLAQFINLLLELEQAQFVTDCDLLVVCQCPCLQPEFGLALPQFFSRLLARVAHIGFQSERGFTIAGLLQEMKAFHPLKKAVKPWRYYAWIRSLPQTFLLDSGDATKQRPQGISPRALIAIK